MPSLPDQSQVKIREMEVDDIPGVYHLGDKLFRGPDVTTLYRTWDAYEVTTGFNQDPELCLVAEDGKGQLIGFALGTTYEKERAAWKYGHLVWLGVRAECQGAGVGSKLYRETEARMRAQSVRMLIMDTSTTNSPAIEFFKHMGFGKPNYQVWMSKILR